MTTIEASGRDEEEFEAWYELPADQTLNDPKLYRQYLDDTLLDHTKTFCEKAYMAALKAERERSAVLVEALEKLKPAFDIVHDHYLAFEELASVIGVNMEKELAERVKTFWEAHEAFEEALKAYRGEGLACEI